MTDLASKKCPVCESWMPPLTGDKLQSYVSQVSDEWDLRQAQDKSKRIVRAFSFKNFVEAMGFINMVAGLAEMEGHHPNMRLHGWNNVEIELYTHKIQGLHEADFVMAAKIDRLV